MGARPDQQVLDQQVLKFLVAARRCEMAALEHLRQAVRLVGVVRKLVHCLQRERGALNLYLGSRGERYGERLVRYRAEAEAEREAFLQHLSVWLTPESRGLQCSRLLGASRSRSMACRGFPSCAPPYGVRRSRRRR